MLFGFLLFSSSLHAQTASNAKLDKKQCQKPCNKSPQANALQTYVPLFALAAGEQRASTPDTAEKKTKVNCQKPCSKKAMAKVNCDPKDCPKECLPANCKIASCTKPQNSKAVALNKKP